MSDALPMQTQTLDLKEKLIANLKHIDILIKGVKAWNEWRNTEAGRRADLSDVDFFSANKENQYSILPE